MRASVRAPIFGSRPGFGLSFVVLLLVAALASCGGDDGDDDEKQAKPIAGSFVGKIPKSEAFVSVVASAPAKGQDKRRITVFVCDAESICELFSGEAAGNDFVAKSSGNEGEAKGKLTDKAASGTIEVPDGETLEYEAGQATATSGLYDLDVKKDGRLTGASAAGVALKGTTPLPDTGNGSLKLADGRRLKFEVTRNSEDPVLIPAAKARLIVLAEGELRGAAKTQGGEDSDYFMRSKK